MVRAPSLDGNGMKKGAWSEEEDNKLRAYVLRYGHWNWRLLPKYAGLSRCGKSCRLRWVNYLKPGIKRGNFSKEEEDLIINLHARLGNKWSAIAANLPGRSDNEIKNFYHTRIEKFRKRNPKVQRHASQASSIDDDQENPPENDLTTRDASSIEESTLSLDTNISPHDQTTEPGMDLWSDIFQTDSNHDQNDGFPPFMGQEFLYPQLHYSELSSSDSSYMSALDWIADEDHSNIISSEYVDPSFHGSLWSESSASNSNYVQSDESPTQEAAAGFYDPLFQCFDYGMNLFS